MGNIHVLDENTINKIAAGEVIERPASIVKELIENSLDAEASSISIEITEGGKSYISVKDNGRGILQSDAEQVFLRHATSKIEKAEDLFRINTMGFRGEAMASIAAVSEVELTTRTEEETDGTFIDIRGGALLENKIAGHPVGTSVIVRNLFFNTPARKKFLKSDLSEQGAIVDVVERQALAHPEVSIRLIMDGKNVLHTPGNGDLLSVIQCIYGKNVVKSLIEVDHPSESMRVTGYTSKTELTRGNSTYILCDFNGRPVKSRTVIKSVKQSYRSLLMNNRYPFAILRIETNPEIIDVNVHPQKHEIRLTDERALFNTIYIAIKSALNRSVMILGASDEAIQQTEIHAGQSLLNIAGKKADSEKSVQLEKSTNYDKPVKNETPINYDKQVNYEIPINFDKSAHSEKPMLYEKPTLYEKAVDYEKTDVAQNTNREETVHGSAPQISNFKIIGQHLNTYILIQVGEDLFVVDQHAAHERINYEYLRDSYNRKEIHIQNLMMPVLIEVSLREKVSYESKREILTHFGIDMEWFGDTTMAVRSVPVIVGEPLSGRALSDILSDILSERDPNELTEKIIKSMACKNSVKAFNKLSIEEMEGLMNRLFQCKDPYNCPHGRPVIISFTKLDLEKRFKRIL